MRLRFLVCLLWVCVHNKVRGHLPQDGFEPSDRSLRRHGGAKAGTQINEMHALAKLLLASRAHIAHKVSRPLHGGFGDHQQHRRVRSMAVMKHWERPQVRQVDGEACNVAVTHKFADFDSLAAAVALVKLWEIARPDLPSFVCMPEGANPMVDAYLAHHKQVLPVRGFKTFRPENIRALGVLDTTEVSRIGRAADWLNHSTYIHVLDHHIAGSLNDTSMNVIKYDELTTDAVGSVTTLVVEQLRNLYEQQQKNVSLYKNILVLTEPELTLFSLGILADTINFVVPSTTARDVKAHAWLLDMGASQQAISFYAQARPSEHHAEYLAEALKNTVVIEHEGRKVGVVHGSFAKGGAYVAYDTLLKLSLDVLLLGVTSSTKKHHTLSVIGRCSCVASPPVNLNDILAKIGGGGHPPAASATIRWKPSAEDTADSVAEKINVTMQGLLQEVLQAIPKQPIAKEIMSTEVATLNASCSIKTAMELMSSTGILSVPVISKNGRLEGMVKYGAVVKALEEGRDDIKIQTIRTKAYPINATTSLSDINKKLERTTNLIVVDEDRHVIGIVTSNHILSHSQIYKNMHVPHGAHDAKNHQLA